MDMENKLKTLIEKYKNRCKEIEDQWCSIDEDGKAVFDYDGDYDDQLMTAEVESEYYTLLSVIEELLRLETTEDNSENKEI